MRRRAKRIANSSVVRILASREAVLEISIRKQDSTARASRRLGAISINMDAVEEAKPHNLWSQSPSTTTMALKMEWWFTAILISLYGQ